LIYPGPIIIYSTRRGVVACAACVTWVGPVCVCLSLLHAPLSICIGCIRHRPRSRPVSLLQYILVDVPPALVVRFSLCLPLPLGLSLPLGLFVYFTFSSVLGHHPSCVKWDNNNSIITSTPPPARTPPPPATSTRICIRQLCTLSSAYWAEGSSACFTTVHPSICLSIDPAPALFQTCILRAPVSSREGELHAARSCLQTLLSLHLIEPPHHSRSNDYPHAHRCCQTALCSYQWLAPPEYDEPQEPSEWYASSHP
jgi:hypothetical protein